MRVSLLIRYLCCWLQCSSGWTEGLRWTLCYEGNGQVCDVEPQQGLTLNENLDLGHFIFGVNSMHTHVFLSSCNRDIHSTAVIKYVIEGSNVIVNHVQVHRACMEREIISMLDHPFLPTLYSSFQVFTSL